VRHIGSTARIPPCTLQHHRCGGGAHCRACKGHMLPLSCERRSNPATVRNSPSSPHPRTRGSPRRNAHTPRCLAARPAAELDPEGARRPGGRCGAGAGGLCSLALTVWQVACAQLDHHSTAKHSTLLHDVRFLLASLCPCQASMPCTACSTRLFFGQQRMHLFAFGAPRQYRMLHRAHI
jgi:hypothetical protein